MTLEAPRRSYSPWQWFYGAAHRLRQRYYVERARSLPRPVISVGNLHWGGSGKTPLTAALAAHLRDGGRQVAILSRGYGGSGSGVRIVSQGDGPLLGPGLCGDEPVLLAGLLPGVSVVVCADRYLAGRHALERLDRQPDVFLLDDGFSHVALRRDLDILVFPASDPFAGGRLAPSGRLREPLASSSRAHAAVLTGLDLDHDAGPQLAAALAPFGFEGPGFIAPTVADPIRSLGDRQPIAEGSRLLVVTGIARPDRVIETVESQGFQVVDTLAFADHHAYPEVSRVKIARAFESSGADWVVTTTKDGVKLRGKLDVPLAVVPIEARPEPECLAWLGVALDALDQT